jgi:hypothetical protein
MKQYTFLGILIVLLTLILLYQMGYIKQYVIPVNPLYVERAQAAEPYDLDRLAYAISVPETSGCTKGVGASKNNCCSINSSRGFLKMVTKKAGLRACKRLWKNKYDVLPNVKVAARYTGNPDPSEWLKNVLAAYGKP